MLLLKAKEKRLHDAQKLHAGVHDSEDIMEVMKIGRSHCVSIRR